MTSQQQQQQETPEQAYQRIEAADFIKYARQRIETKAIVADEFIEQIRKANRS